MFRLAQAHRPYGLSSALVYRFHNFSNQYMRICNAVAYSIISIQLHTLPTAVHFIQSCDKFSFKLLTTMNDVQLDDVMPCGITTWPPWGMTFASGLLDLSPVCPVCLIGNHSRTPFRVCYRQRWRWLKLAKPVLGSENPLRNDVDDSVEIP